RRILRYRAQILNRQASCKWDRLAARRKYDVGLTGAGEERSMGSSACAGHTTHDRVRLSQHRWESALAQRSGLRCHSKQRERAGQSHAPTVAELLVVGAARPGGRGALYGATASCTGRIAPALCCWCACLYSPLAARLSSTLPGLVHRVA